jgi:uncharacterized protein (TIGR00106 family)
MLAQISMTPVGSGEETKELVAKTLAIVKKSDLSYQLTSMGTIVEGDWDEIMLLVKKCHEEMKHLADRVVTNIVIDDRKDLTNRLRDNVLEIEYVLGEGLETRGLT